MPSLKMLDMRSAQCTLKRISQGSATYRCCPWIVVASLCMEAELRRECLEFLRHCLCCRSRRVSADAGSQAGQQPQLPAGRPAAGHKQRRLGVGLTQQQQQTCSLRKVPSAASKQQQCRHAPAAPWTFSSSAA